MTRLMLLLNSQNTHQLLKSETRLFADSKIRDR